MAAANKTNEPKFAGALPDEGDEPIAEAAEVLEARLAAVPAPIAEGDVLGEMGIEDGPAFDPYYNPRVPGELFRVEGSRAFRRFQNGRFQPTNEAEEKAVRGALRAYGRGREDLWKGDDMVRPWICKKCKFVTRNERAMDAHIGFQLHG